MKAITVMQPWATLIALGEKQYETRSWSTFYRGEIAIHAAKAIDKQACHHPDIQVVLHRHGYTTRDLPRGAVIAKAKLIDCLQSMGETEQGYVLSDGREISDPEWLFGDFEAGRYAWQLAAVECLFPPIAAKGRQRLWDWEWGEQKKTPKQTYKIMEGLHCTGTIKTRDIHNFIHTNYRDIVNKIVVDESRKEIRFHLSFIESIQRAAHLEDTRKQKKQLQ